MSHVHLVLLLIYIHIFSGTRGVILLGERGVSEDYKSDLFPNVVVPCIDIYADHRSIYNDELVDSAEYWSALTVLYSY